MFVHLGNDFYLQTSESCCDKHQRLPTVLSTWPQYWGDSSYMSGHFQSLSFRILQEPRCLSQILYAIVIGGGKSNIVLLQDIIEKVTFLSNVKCFWTLPGSCSHLHSLEFSLFMCFRSNHLIWDFLFSHEFY